MPAVDQPFQWRETAAGPALVCSALEPFASHLFTTRAWPLGSMGAADDAATHWADVARACGAGALVRLKQVHGRSSAIVDAPVEHLPEADIVATRREGIAIAVQAADCVPLLIVDRHGAIAAAHAGWRGMAARVPQEAVTVMARAFGSRPADLLVAAGPSIGACCYEVGVDVRDAFRSAGFGDTAIDRWFVANRPSHWMFDGWSSVREQLIEAGVPDGQIFLSRMCTSCHAAAWPSYRRDGVGAGRIAAAILLRPREADAIAAAATPGGRRP